MSNKVLPRVALYGLLAAAAAATLFALRWHRWSGYTCRVGGDGIEIYSDYDRATVTMLHGFARAFRGHFDSSVIPLPPDRKGLRIYLFKSQPAYYDYCRRVRAGGSPFGFYSRRHRLIAINGTMGFATIMHEMVHHFMHQAGVRMPEWLEEGLASYYERGMGYYQSDNDCLMLFGYLNPIRFQEVQSLAYERGLTFKAMASNQQLAGTFFVFADRRKAMGSFLRCYLATGDLEESCRQAFGTGREATEREWTDFVRTTVLGLDFEFWQKAAFFGSRKGFEEWLDSQGARWDPGKEVYMANR